MSAAVEAFRGIALLIFKWLLIVVVGVLATAAIAAALIWFWEWYSHTRHVEKIRTVIHIDKCDNPKFPLLVGFVNNSDKTVQKISFALSARRKGRSTDLARYHDYVEDSIIKPKDGMGQCWAVPPLSETADYKELEWSINRVYFTLSD